MIIKKSQVGGDAAAVASLLAAFPSHADLLGDKLDLQRAADEGEVLAARYIDQRYGAGDNIAVIHGLRFKGEGGRTVRIDHLLVNRNLRFVLVDSRSFPKGLRIMPDGEFRRRDPDGKTVGVPSPILAGQRRAEGLHQLLLEKSLLPRRLGFPVKPSFANFVLVSPKSMIDRPAPDSHPNVCKSDAFGTAYVREPDLGVIARLNSLGSFVSAPLLERIATGIASEDVPESLSPAQRFRLLVGEDMPHAAVSPAAPPSATAPLAVHGPRVPMPGFLATEALEDFRCRSCPDGAVEVRKRYSYHFHCVSCGAKRAIRLAEGVSVVQDGGRFFLRRGSDAPRFFYDNAAAAGVRREIRA